MHGAGVSSHKPKTNTTRITSTTSLAIWNSAISKPKPDKGDSLAAAKAAIQNRRETWSDYGRGDTVMNALDQKIQIMKPL